MTSNKRFTYEQVSFPYSLTLEPRRTIAVSVFPDQSVRVMAPLLAKAEKVDDFLRRKFRWVLKHRRYFARFKPRPEKEYVSGETVRYLGRNYKLLVRKETATEHVSLQHGTLTVFSSSPEDPVQSRTLLSRWYTLQARKHFRERLDFCRAKYNIRENPELVIRSMKRRWGSYSSKTNRICLNLELIKASRHQIDYVLTHELGHLTHAAHDKAFYRLLDTRFPDWEKVKDALEEALVGIVNIRA